MDYPSSGRGIQGFLIGFAIVTVVTLLCVGLTATVLDANCQALFENNLPIYPGAEILYTEYIFMEVKQMEIFIQAPPDEVRSWYVRTIGVAMREDAQNGTRTAWQGQYIIAAATDNSATQVLLRVQCRTGF